MKSVAVIGSGFAGISCACHLAKAGFNVVVFEKNSSPGGRARKFCTKDFTFDMGPSWYWMPDVFDKFFANFNKKTSDYYQLKRLSPSYRAFFSKEDVLDVPSDITSLIQMFEKIEPGSGEKLQLFLAEGKYKYEVGVGKLVYKPGLSFVELMDTELLKGITRLHIFKSLSAYVRKYFKDPRLILLLEFPVLFLGASPEKIPSLYSLMNYADMVLGTWYPKGGMHRVVDGMFELATSLGVKFHFNSKVQEIKLNGSLATGIKVNGKEESFDYVVAAADYHHVENSLLPASHRNYKEVYWEKRVMAPSCLIFYLGVNKRLNSLLHHNLFFDQDFKTHIREIYENPSWPTNPLFYVCCTSKSDESVAPEGHENVFILIPVATGLNDDEKTRDRYFEMVLKRLEYICDDNIREHIVYKRSYAHSDFIADYNAYNGNAYGLANILAQTANLKPSIKNKRVQNLFYTGQLTVPGPGVPPSIISGEVVAQQLVKEDEGKIGAKYQ